MRGLDVLNNPSVDSLLKAVAGGGALPASLGVVPTGLVDGGVEGRGAGHGLVGGGQEDDLGVGGLGHGLHGLEVADLHGRGGREDVGGLAHELGGLDLGLGGDDLALANTLALGGHGQGTLELLAEDDVLDEHALDPHAPAERHVLDDLPDALRELLAALDDVLQDARAHDVAEGRLRALDEGLLHVRDAEGHLVRARDVVVDDGREVDGDVVLGHADLSGDLCFVLPPLVMNGLKDEELGVDRSLRTDNLNLHVDLDKTLAERVDLD